MLLNYRVLISFITPFCVLLPLMVASSPTAQEDPNYPASKRVPRVAGGSPVPLTKYPFVAHISSYLVRKYKKTKRIICTGVVIHPEYVLTAASCFEQLVRENHNTKEKSLKREIKLGKYEKTFVRAGSVNGSRFRPLEHQDRMATTLYIHTEYLHVSTMFDVNVALLHMDKPFDFTFAFVKQAALAKKIGPKGEFLNNFCLGMGFGYRNIKEANLNATPDPAEYDVPEYYYLTVLRQFKVKAGGSWLCRNLEKELTKKIVHFDSFYLCAVSKNIRGWRNNCDGDVGGPLVCGGLVIGVLSDRREKKPCDVTGMSFSMYSEVGSDIVYEWIKTIVPDVGPIRQIPFEDPVNGTQWYPDEPED